MTKKHVILLVDDEPYILSSLKRILRGEDREIYTAECAAAAWDILKSVEEVEVIVSDNRMPDTLGLDFLTKVKRLYPDTIRILMTGYPDLNSAMEAINKASIWRYILKPVEVDDLKVLIMQAFDYFRIMKENRLLLQVARQQAEWIKVLKEKYPNMSTQEINKQSSYAMDEQYISELMNQFQKKYFAEEDQGE